MSMYLCQPKYDITHVVAHIECEFCCTSMKEGHKCLFNLEITAVCCTTDGSGTHGTKKQFQWHSCPDQRFSGLPGIMESFSGTHGIFSIYIGWSINPEPSDQTDLNKWRRLDLKGGGKPTFEVEADWWDP